MKKFTLGKSRDQVIKMIPDRQIKQVQLGPTKICVTRIGVDFFAFELLCPHQKASLYQGSVTGLKQLICPLHSYRFDLTTGSVVSGQCPELTTYRCELSDEGLNINL